MASSPQGDCQLERKHFRRCGILVWGGGGTPSKRCTEYWENADIRWFTAKDFTSDNLVNSQDKTNKLGIENSSAKYLAGPALGFVVRSGILKRYLPVARIDGKFTVNQDIKVLAVDVSKYNADYVKYFCLGNNQNIRLSSMKSGTTVESIDFVKLKKISVPYPIKEEQNEIARLLEELISREHEAVALAQSSLHHIKVLKKGILDRAFKGQLGTSQPEDETALEMLTRQFEEEYDRLVQEEPAS